MIFTWAGFACFKIEGNSASVATDPFSNSTGRKLPKILVDIVLSSKADEYHGNVSGVIKKGDDIMVISGAGEYEVKDVLIYGIEAKNNNDGGKKQDSGSIIYKVQMDGLNIVFLGDLGFELEEDQLNSLGSADILMVSVGGGRYLTPKKAAELVSKIEPRVVIPMCYKAPSIKEALASVNDFCKELGASAKETVTKYKITKKDLPADQTQVVVFDIS